MTTTPSQRARELLAAEMEAAGSAIAARMLRDGWPATGATVPALRAIEAALRLPAGEGWVLVPREPTDAMLDAGWAEGAKWCEAGAPDFAAAWTAMLAAAPRHETGEG